MNRTQKLATTAVMAALCYVAFTFLQIKIPTPAGYTSFHLGNVFCVLAALMIDGVSGGIAGAIGMGIGDLFDPAYVITAPKTIFLKFFIGFISGTIAHKVFRINECTDRKLVKATILSCLAGMAFNMIGEPVVSYLYYNVILSNSEKALSYLTAAKFLTTSVNAVLTVIVASLLYIPVSRRLRNYLEEK
ncbi:MAG: ECF transporter S component [Erysipelotrichaceae bacterium]|nr:ECF transporter S component [Erysipelotrichaceae bacterium]